jgi:hypothetical protein
MRKSKDSRWSLAGVDHINVECHWQGTRISSISLLSSPSFSRCQRALTIHRVLSNDLPNLLDNPLVSNLLDVLRMRDHEADLLVVVIVVPGV